MAELTAEQQIAERDKDRAAAVVQQDKMAAQTIAERNVQQRREMVQLAAGTLGQNAMSKPAAEREVTAAAITTMAGELIDYINA
jgi:hypothetical protein